MRPTPDTLKYEFSSIQIFFRPRVTLSDIQISFNVTPDRKPLTRMIVTKWKDHACTATFLLSQVRERKKNVADTEYISQVTQQHV